MCESDVVVYKPHPLVDIGRRFSLLARVAFASARLVMDQKDPLGEKTALSSQWIQVYS